MADRRELTRFEAVLDAVADRFLSRVPAGLREFLVLATVIVFFRCRMYFSVHPRTLTMPVLLAFVLVAFFIWVAENIGTAAGAWLYPSQDDGWHLVPLTKLVAWFLLMMISVVLVTFVHRPRLPEVHRPEPPDTYTC